MFFFWDTVTSEKNEVSSFCLTFYLPAPWISA